MDDQVVRREGDVEEHGGGGAVREVEVVCCSVLAWVVLLSWRSESTEASHGAVAASVGVRLVMHSGECSRAARAAPHQQATYLLLRVSGCGMSAMRHA